MKFEFNTKILAMIMLEVMAILSAILLPLFLGGLVDSMGLPTYQAGLVTSAEMGGIFLGTVVILFWGDLFGRQKWTVLGLIILLIANLISSIANHFYALLLFRFISGIGAGLVIATVKACMAELPNPVKVFAWLSIAVLVAGGLVMPAMSPLIKLMGMPGTYIILAVAILISFPLVKYIPANSFVQSQANGLSTKIFGMWSIIGLLALLCYYVSHAAVVAYLERIAKAQEIPSEIIGTLLGLASFAGIAGAGIASWLGSKRGRLAPALLGLSISILAVGILCRIEGIIFFSLGAISVMAASTFTVPYFLDALVKLDNRGRVLVAGLLMQSIGLAAGPAIGGFIFHQDKLEILGAFFVFGYLLAALLFAWLHKNKSNFQTF